MRTSWTGATRAALTLFFTAIALLAFAVGSANAAFVFQNDVGGANEPPDGQTDLTRVGVDTATLPATLGVQWNWDETSLPGSNTGDGCAMFDTDADGRVNYSVCVTAGGDPLVLESTTLYSCGDDKVDRCTNPELIDPFTTSCTVNQTATDPFTEGDEYPDDTTADCSIVMSEVGGASAELVNVCSFPSREPNSNPFDCILALQKVTPTLTTTASESVGLGGSIHDVAHLSNTLDGQGTGTITFHLYGPNDETCAGEPVSSEVEVDGDGDYQSNSVAPALPGVYRWVAEYSGDESNNPVVTQCGDVNEIVTILGPAIDLRKSVSASTVEPGTIVTFTVEVENIGGVTLGSVNIADDTCIPLSGPAGDAGDDLMLSPGEIWTYTCSMAINVDTVNVATVTAMDEHESVVGDQASASVTVVAPVQAQAVPKNVVLSRTSGCTSRKLRVTASASGGTVSSARLYIDGRLKATRKSGRFVINTAKYSPGVHKIRVVTTFTDGQTVTRTGSFRRCQLSATKRVSPQFTG